MQASITKLSVGVDVAADDFKVAALALLSNGEEQCSKTKTFTNDTKGHQGFLKELQKQTPAMIVMEATGVYYERLAYFLAANGYNVSVQLPNKVEAFKKSLNVKTKTDAADALVLATMG